MARDVNFGADETDAKWQISDDGTPGDFVLARDTNGNTVLLKWNDTTGQWEYGGPVDLNGNDLEDGATTVYDASTDTVGDGTNTSADHTSVSTGDVDVTGVSDAATTTLIEALNGSEGGQIHTQPTDGVGTSATDIFDRGTTGANAFMIVVWGDEQNATNRFADIILTNRTTSTVVTVDSNERDTPASRTYSSSGDEITLAMGSGTYDVTATGMGATRQQN